MSMNTKDLMFIRSTIREFQKNFKEATDSTYAVLAVELGISDGRTIYVQPANKPCTTQETEVESYLRSKSQQPLRQGRIRVQNWIKGEFLILIGTGASTIIFNTAVEEIWVGGYPMVNFSFEGSKGDEHVTVSRNGIGIVAAKYPSQFADLKVLSKALFDDIAAEVKSLKIPEGQLMPDPTGEKHFIYVDGKPVYVMYGIPKDGKIEVTGLVTDRAYFPKHPLASGSYSTYAEFLARLHSIQNYAIANKPEFPGLPLLNEEETLAANERARTFPQDVDGDFFHAKHNGVNIFTIYARYGTPDKEQEEKYKGFKILVVVGDPHVEELRNHPFEVPTFFEDWEQMFQFLA